ncbi:MAG TPA: DNA polymerase III subunit gamma/tau [Verrucomicrobiae bacterium]|nr:DNA polymerase III subunit gamma/tau [Verrucomicrobiae bacterium]
MSETLYRKYRSQTFAELVGQGPIARTLRAAVRDGRVSHAYLFTGIRGTGKTSAARILARAINCAAPLAGEPCNSCEACRACLAGTTFDVLEIDAATNRGIDEIRDLRERVRFLPAHLRRKIYIVDEVHMLTVDAANAFLKTLEEPPPHVCFILATTEPHRLVDTVLSRCQRYDFRRIEAGEIATWLATIAAREGAEAEPEALALVAEAAGGSMRDAISLLDRVIGLGEDRVTQASVRDALGLVDPAAVGELADALAAGDPATVLQAVEGFHAQGADPRQLLRALGELARVRLLQGPAPTQADAPPSGFWVATLAACAQGTVTVRRADDGRLALESVLLGLLLGGAGGLRQFTPPPAIRRGARPAPGRPAAGPAPAPPPSRAASPLPEPEEGRPADLADPAADPPAALVPVAGWEARWAEVLDQIRRRHVPTQALLKAAVPVAYQDGRLTVAVTHAFHLQQIAEPATRRLLEEACAEVVGHPVQVALVAAEPAAPARPAAIAEGTLRTALEVFPGSRVARSQFRDP